jgi:hypothetical protein
MLINKYYKISKVLQHFLDFVHLGLQVAHRLVLLNLSLDGLNNPGPLHTCLFLISARFSGFAPDSSDLYHLLDLVFLESVSGRDGFNDAVSQFFKVEIDVLRADFLILGRESDQGGEDLSGLETGEVFGLCRGLDRLN